MERLLAYFTNGITSQTLKTIGAEVETQFVDADRRPITAELSQKLLATLVSRGSWRVVEQKGELIGELSDRADNRVRYELGRHNLEIATAPTHLAGVIPRVTAVLEQLYGAAHAVNAQPLFEPFLVTDEDTLIVPDERDKTWIALDGRGALAPLACISSVQFTISVSPTDAVPILNALGAQRDVFVADYPQDTTWRRYVHNSRAGYLPDRYGGPRQVSSMHDYCLHLAKHAVVRGDHLVPMSSVGDLDVALHLRSIWWHFRLKRYGDALCIEVRPLPRRSDDQLSQQLLTILDVVS